MYKKKSNIKGHPKLGIDVVGRAVAGVKETTSHAVKHATKTFVKDPLAKVGTGFDLRRNKIFGHRRGETTEISPASRELTDDDDWGHPKDNEKAFLLTELARNFLFSGLDADRLARLSSAFERVIVPKGTTIISQGAPGDYFFVLYSGNVVYYVDEKRVGSSYDQEDSAKCFGELALLFSAPRAATVMAESNCVLYRLGQDDFRRVVEKKGDEIMQTRLDILETVPMLQEIDADTANALVDAMKVRHFKKGDVLFEKDDVINTFIIVQSGALRVSEIVWGGANYEEILVGPAESQRSIGWLPMIQGKTMSAEVTAIADATILAIEGEEFRRLIGPQEEVWGKVALIRQLKGIAVFTDSKLDHEQFVSLIDLILRKRYKSKATLFKEGDKVDACICFVRNGSVELTSKTDGFTKKIDEGGFFGQEWLLADQNKEVKEGSTPEVVTKYTAKVEVGTVLDTLFLEDIRKVVNTSQLGLGKPVKVTGIDSSIKVTDIKRHKMLGTGSFGQVWLASYTTPGGDSKKSRLFALKVQSKHQLIESGQVEGVLSEVNIMTTLKSPFIIRMFSAFQDPQRVYMLTSLLQGGELESLMGDKAMVEHDAQFYAAGILEGLAYMHRRHIIHRDLKPENVLINSKGYPVLIDLGFAKYVPDKTYTFCGTPMYIAPEVIQYKGHDKCADYWSWACIVFEMVTAKYPFYESGMAELELFKKICRGQFKLYGFMSFEVKYLIISLFVPDATMRLGSRPNGWKDIFSLSFFKGFDFESLRRLQLSPPWIPDLKNPLDSSNFSDCSNAEDKMTANDPALTESQQKIFHAFGNNMK
eukprot:Nitzschia sp. Nitz4//scaffold200_size39268//3333//5875//NITZ4_007610-RA/size39268-augustus-gene-0.66-mRNA-1//1//CDS//3329541268//1254//frame0